MTPQGIEIPVNECIRFVLLKKIEIYDQISDQPENKLEKNLFKNLIGEVVFENVSFFYRPDEPIINDLSFKMPPACSAGKNFNNIKLLLMALIISEAVSIPGI